MEILRDVKEAAATYGVTILRADVKDPVFPGNLREIMNRVRAAERMSQEQLVEARKLGASPQQTPHLERMLVKCRMHQRLTFSNCGHDAR